MSSLIDTTHKTDHGAVRLMVGSSLQLHLIQRARAEQAMAMRRALRALLVTSFDLVGLRPGFVFLKRMALARRTENELLALDSRYLADIGILRAEIPAIAWASAKQQTPIKSPAWQAIARLVSRLSSAKRGKGALADDSLAPMTAPILSLAQHLDGSLGKARYETSDRRAA